MTADEATFWRMEAEGHTTDAMHASVTFLTFSQLLAAATVSQHSYEARFRAFIAACEGADILARRGEDITELRADMTTLQAAYRAQAAMSQAIADEISARVKRGDYA